MTDRYAIRCSGVSKRYSKSPKHGDLRSTLSSIFKKADKEDPFWAVKDISFTIERGETVGIIGRNGAGKSTLLKLLSKITHPTEGKIEINGRLTSLLEVGTGFHPQMTGKENIYLNGSLLGMTRQEIKKRLENIIEFSGVREFIDMPVKHYSSGMYVRLAFAVAAHLRTDILLVDEILAVGDAFFQEKSLNKMNEVVNEGRTVLLVSHNLEHINTLCKKAIFLDNGKIKYFGAVKNAIKMYNDSYLDKTILKYEYFKVLSNNVLIQDSIHSYSGSEIRLDIILNQDMLDLTIVRLIILDSTGLELTILKSSLFFELSGIRRNQPITCIIPKLPLNEGFYYLSIELKSSKETLARKEYKFVVAKGVFFDTTYTISNKFNFLIDHQWTVNKNGTKF